MHALNSRKPGFRSVAAQRLTNIEFLERRTLLSSLVVNTTGELIKVALNAGQVFTTAVFGKK